MTSPVIVGNKSDFAIGFELDVDYDGTWLYGRICYYANDFRIGNYDTVTSLRDFLMSFRLIASDCGHRTASDLFRLSKQDFFLQVDQTLYGSIDTGFEQLAQDETWVRFSITPEIDVFNSWKVYLVDSGEQSRLLWRNVTNGAVAPIFEHFIPLGVADAAIRGTYEQLYDLYMRESSNER